MYMFVVAMYVYVAKLLLLLLLLIKDYKASKGFDKRMFQVS